MLTPSGASGARCGCRAAAPSRSVPTAEGSHNGAAGRALHGAGAACSPPAACLGAACLGAACFGAASWPAVAAWAAAAVRDTRAAAGAAAAGGDCGASCVGGGCGEGSKRARSTVCPALSCRNSSSVTVSRSAPAPAALAALTCAANAGFVGNSGKTLIQSALAPAALGALTSAPQN